MAGTFDPGLVTESVEYLKKFYKEADLQPGESPSLLSRTVSNNGTKVELCYSFGDTACSNCVVDYCLFNPNRKEG